MEVLFAVNFAMSIRYTYTYRYGRREPVMTGAEHHWLMGAVLRVGADTRALPHTMCAASPGRAAQSSANTLHQTTTANTHTCTHVHMHVLRSSNHTNTVPPSLLLATTCASWA